MARFQADFRRFMLPATSGTWWLPPCSSDTLDFMSFMERVVYLSESGSATGVGERSRSLGRILARRRDFCRPRAGEPRKSDAL
ncbi:MAG: hypothetical protein DWI27_05610 [Planctomycetota bacterium]|jgi:hypothetical protein|nr:MAG: hypothetical protein DWI27_05610 [Planctomycetota bacterium]